jgi:hypothetical protein
MLGAILVLPQLYTRSAELFLGSCDPMMRQLAIAPLVSRSLLAHGLPANTVLAGSANARFRPRRGFAADHAFLVGSVIIFVYRK